MPAQQIYKISKNKKTILLVSALIIIPVFILLLSMSYRGSNSQDTNTEKNTSNQNQSSSPTSPFLTSWIKHDGESLSLEYSPDWSIQQEKIAGGGEIIILNPNGLPPGIQYPKLIIQTQPFSAEALDGKITILKALGLAQSEINILNIKATKLNGTIPFKNSGNTNLAEPIQETNILLNKHNILYLIQYSYEGSVESPVLEKYFREVIEGIKFK